MCFSCLSLREPGYSIQIAPLHHPLTILVRIPHLTLLTLISYDALLRSPTHLHPTIYLVLGTRAGGSFASPQGAPKPWCQPGTAAC
jgi:hypothetical protein